MLNFSIGLSIIYNLLSDSHQFLQHWISLEKKSKFLLKFGKKNQYSVIPLLIRAKVSDIYLNELKFVFQSCSFENSNFKRGAMKNNMHYSKQNTADATRVTAALASPGQQTSHSFSNRCVSSLVMQYTISLLKTIKKGWKI